MTKINQVKEGKLRSIVLNVVEKGESKEGQNKSYGESFKVALCKGKDETGEILFSVWNEDIQKFEVGDTVEILNGFVNNFKGALQVTTGRFGAIQLIKKA